MKKIMVYAILSFALSGALPLHSAEAGTSDHELFEYVVTGNVDMLERARQQGVDFATREVYESPMLELAVRQGPTNVLWYLLHTIRLQPTHRSLVLAYRSFENRDSMYRKPSAQKAHAEAIRKLGHLRRKTTKRNLKKFANELIKELNKLLPLE